MSCPINHDTPSDSSTRSSITSIMNGHSINTGKMELIPQPPMKYFGLLGHAPEIDLSFPVKSLWRLMDTYGPIYEVNLQGSKIFVGTNELLRELLDEEKWVKIPAAPQQQLRAASGDGLVTAYSHEKNWWKAHRLLAPAFGPLGLRRMFDDMLELSSQLVLMWDRFGPDNEIDCVEDLTRLTFDTIGLCAFNFRFNEFYTDEPHPFARQLGEVLMESGKRAHRPEILNRLLFFRDEQRRQENIVEIHTLCDKIIQDRLENPMPDATDLLNVLLHGIDKETGEKLPLENVKYQIGTFLAAGYETTASTLSFFYYHLCDNPDKLDRLQAEVDQVLGDKVITVDMLPKLVYLDACIKETLRLNPPANIFTRCAIQDTLLAGKYLIKKDVPVSCLLRCLHRDPKIWGNDAEAFRPERLMGGAFEALPKGAWQPFGDGLRACIGKSFSFQEMYVTIAQVLQRFHIRKADPSYKLVMRSNMTTKPANFKMKVARRPGRNLMFGVPGSAPASDSQQQKSKSRRARAAQPATTEPVGSASPLNVFIGGNSGTCESLAQDLVRKAPGFGLLVEIKDLDDAVDKLPTDSPSVIITASYEGKPPGNAKKFLAWLEALSLGSSSLPKSTRYAVFGVGNSDWSTTFHRIPRLVDDTLLKLGAERIIDSEYANAKLDILGPWEDWSDQLCSSLCDQAIICAGAGYALTRGLEVLIESAAADPVSGSEDSGIATVVLNRELADNSIGAAKRQVDLRLPAGVGYTTGDYLFIIGQNPQESVLRVMERFKLGRHDIITIKSSSKDFLVTGPTTVSNFLSTRVEIAAPITRRQISALVEFAKNGSQDHKQLDMMQEDSVYYNLLSKRYSVLDVLDELPGLDLPFSTYLEFLHPLSPRQYSISSSPLEAKVLCPSISNNTATHYNNNHDGIIASITFDVLESPAQSGHGIFRGVVGNYLAASKPGDRVRCFVRPNKLGFRLPANKNTPIIMVAAGTGIAPLRAFIAERAVTKQAAGEHGLDPAVLYFGCRNMDKDYLYGEELAMWQKQGVVEVVPCFSRPSGTTFGRHVDAALWEDRDRVWPLMQQGAMVFVCGSASKLGRSVAQVFKRIWRENTRKNEKEADEWLDGMKDGRYITDVY